MKVDRAWDQQCTQQGLSKGPTSLEGGCDEALRERGAGAQDQASGGILEELPDPLSLLLNG